MYLFSSGLYHASRCRYNGCAEACKAPQKHLRSVQKFAKRRKPSEFSFAEFCRRRRDCTCSATNGSWAVTTGMESHQSPKIECVIEMTNERIYNPPAPGARGDHWRPSSQSDSVRINYLMISETTPEPTVRPPSRIAKRRPFSQAMGLISSTVISTLSPGRHISTPSGRAMTPVTSVVLK